MKGAPEGSASAEIGNVRPSKLTRDVVFVELGEVAELLGQPVVEHGGVLGLHFGVMLGNYASDNIVQITQREKTLRREHIARRQPLDDTFETTG